MNKYIQYGLAVAVVLSLIVSAKGLIGGNQSGLAGGTTNYDALSLSSTLDVTGATTLASTTATTFKIGQTGTQHSVVISGTCHLLGNASITASTTGGVDCVATGARAGDKVFFNLATTTPYVANMGWIVKAANASSTNDYLTFQVENRTGASAVPSATANFGSSTQYLIIR